VLFYGYLCETATAPKVWGEIFKALPMAKLILRNKQISCLEERESLQLRLSEVGIAPEQVKIGGLLVREDYLAAYSGIDYAGYFSLSWRDDDV